MPWTALDSWLERVLPPGDPRLAHLPLMGSPLPTTAIIICYVFFATSLGPRLMDGRKPFQLQTVLMVYNLCMVLLSVTQFIRSGMYGWFGRYSYRCQAIDYSDSWSGVGMAYTAYVYFLSKIVELLDTVFFVLRKKFNQITVLHVTHHALVAWFVHWGVKYLPGGHGSFQGFANSFVHIFVYSYYLLASFGPRVAPFLWWKKYLTQLQMIQFVVIFLHSIQLLFQSQCNYPRWVLVPYCGIAVYLLVMFTNFYLKSYQKERRVRRQAPEQLQAPGDAIKQTQSPFDGEMRCQQQLQRRRRLSEEESESSKKEL